MAKQKVKPKSSQLQIDLGRPNSEAQKRFFASRSKYTAFGGARGGGKTWCSMRKGLGGALQYPGIKILFIRREYEDLRNSIIEPMLAMLPQGLATYNATLNIIYFLNGSTIKFGNMPGYGAAVAGKYQGQEYDWIFMEEATQFCLHPDTELLLRRGWTKVSEAFRGDEVLSLNPNGTQEFKKIENMFIFKTNEPMYESTQRCGARFCVTHGHKIPVLDKVNGGWKFKQVQNIKDDYIARIGKPLPKDRVEWFEGLAHYKRGYNEATRVAMDDWLEFLGWYLSEGSCFTRAERGTTPVVSIRQTRPAPSLDALMQRLPWRVCHDREGGYRIYSGQLYSVLAPLGNTYQKRVPGYVFDLCHEQINIFLSSFALGDGHEKNGTVGFGLANEGLIDDLQRLYSLVGRIATKGYSTAIVNGKPFDVWRLSVRQDGKYYSRARHAIRQAPCCGYVWCPSVQDNHNFVIRWKGAVSVTGNTEQEFRGMGACLRGVNEIPKRFYLTCNPGGVGHHWVKRLFVDGRFSPGEDPEDYTFIKATVEDNVDLMEANPDYVRALELLPEDIRNAHRYGDWDALGGSYFPEFRRGWHTCAPFRIPDEWAKYRAFDYGLDMFACLWVAIDFSGRCWVYREFAEKDLIVSGAAEVMNAATTDRERIQFTIAPPDMWNRRNDTGKTAAEIFMQNGVGIVKASNSRVQGWLALKELLKPMPDGKPGLIIFEDCKGLIDYIPALQHDNTNPTDCAKEPHEITHLPDALRYFSVMRTMPAITQHVFEDYSEEDERQEDYDEVMRGGKPTASYLFA